MDEKAGEQGRMFFGDNRFGAISGGHRVSSVPAGDPKKLQATGQ